MFQEHMLSAKKSDRQTDNGEVVPMCQPDYTGHTKMCLKLLNY